MPIRKSWRRAAVGLLLLMASTAQAVGTSVRPLRESADAMHLELEFEFPAPLRAEVTVDGVAFTSLELPGLRPEGSPGAPQRFVETQLLGVPPGGGATVRVLSAGQKRRVLLARLLTRPAVLWVLDEAFNALDVAAVQLLGDLIAEHLAGGGMAVLTSHQPLPVPGGKILVL